jgi:HSP20 family protein
MQCTSLNKVIPFAVTCQRAARPHFYGRFLHTTPRIGAVFPSKATQSYDQIPPEQPEQYAVAKRGRQRNFLSPFRMLDMEHEMDSIMRDFGFGSLAKRSIIRPGNMALAIDVVEKEDHFEIKADIPGLKASDIQVQVSADRVLTISGERKNESEHNEDGQYRFERSFGSFARSFKIPDHIDAANIKGSAANGVLKLELPKIDLENEDQQVISVPVTEG